MTYAQENHKAGKGGEGWGGMTMPRTSLEQGPEGGEEGPHVEIRLRLPGYLKGV